MRGHSFNAVKANNPRRSVFDLSHKYITTGNMGLLYPVLCQSMVPGDTFKYGLRSLIRMMPTIYPIMTEIKAYFHTFFVPFRILDEDFSEFITGGEDGDYSTPLSRWNVGVGGNDSGTLWDYFGFPIDVTSDGAEPLIYPLYAYNMIYNEYYRDENVIDERLLTTTSVAKRSWAKDYFTSALPWQQRGTAPALPITGTTSAVFDTGNFTSQNPVTANIEHVSGHLETPSASYLEQFFNDNEVDLSVASTFDISDLRLAIQLQKWMELNARAGVRYPEYLKAHFGQDLGDHTAQRPVYVGGTMTSLIISEVLQSSQSDTTPQGTMAGHGITSTDGYIGTFHANEYGLLMTIMSIMPEAIYQEGIDRQWLYEDNYDFFNPAFVNLSEQAILQAELFASDVDSENNTIFGYQEQYGEMRFAKSHVTGLMRSEAAGSLEAWHLARHFGSAPILNQAFLECTPDNSRIFAVPSQPGFVIELGHQIEAIRPLPLFAEPGFMDH